MFGPEFSYISGTGGNLYFPLPFEKSLKITVEEKDQPVRLYYEIGYRTYSAGTPVETFYPRKTESWKAARGDRFRARIERPRPRRNRREER